MKHEIRASCVLTTKMQPAVFAKLEALAQAWGVSLSAAVRQCIEATPDPDAGQVLAGANTPRTRPEVTATPGAKDRALAANGHQ
jgi:hypothetical protein